MTKAALTGLFLCALPAHPGNRHPTVKWHAYCVGFEMETIMLRDCPTDAKATLALIALSAICILGWLADLGL
ncbi:MAG: hypothetical protein EOP23_20490 [Hyphomicrobiales bacterium]|nr:MAG: hypothetical protein EOP23_20490 [Hyphomicrobiales bacterium]